MSPMVAALRAGPSAAFAYWYANLYHHGNTYWNIKDLWYYNTHRGVLICISRHIIGYICMNYRRVCEFTFWMYSVYYYVYARRNGYNSTGRFIVKTAIIKRAHSRYIVAVLTFFISARAVSTRSLYTLVGIGFYVI